jgi:transcriptional regulator with XRE-family HTH domain
MLSHTQIKDVLALLSQNISERKIAKRTGLSRYSVRKIDFEINQQGHFLRTLSYICPQCGKTFTLFPCPYCTLSPRSSHKSDIKTTVDIPPFSVSLKPKHYQRYLEMRNKVQAEIDANIRTPNSAILSDFVSKY